MLIQKNALMAAFIPSSRRFYFLERLEYITSQKARSPQIHKFQGCNIRSDVIFCCGWHDIAARLKFSGFTHLSSPEAFQSCADANYPESLSARCTPLCTRLFNLR
jgi:hypothetical protein